jgi:elongation factor Ts
MALKERTNAGMMECKKALTEASGDTEKAVELLREWGQVKGATPKSSEMKEGLVAAKIAPDGKLGVMLRLGCQTDFVARNDMFLKLLGDLVELAFVSNITTPAELHALPYPDKPGRTVDQVIKELIGGAIKENMAVTGLARFSTSNGIIGKYVHHNGKVGALVQIDGAANDAVKTLLGEVTMHVTAGMPQVALAVSREQLPAEVVAREKVAAAEGIDPKKPPQIVEKIVAGKLDKVLGEIVLLEQPFVKEEKQKIRDLVAIASKTGGTPVTIARFARLKVGEV